MLRVDLHLHSHYSHDGRSSLQQLIDRAHETPLETELDREAQSQAVCLASDDHREAIAALSERRPARFDR